MPPPFIAPSRTRSELSAALPAPHLLPAHSAMEDLHDHAQGTPNSPAWLQFVPPEVTVGSVAV